VIIRSGVIFAYAAVELVGTAAGETADPAKVMPKAFNSVVFRIAVFCVGSLILLGILLPYTAYKKGTSPFVTFFSTIGVPAAGDIMNFVVLTAALSSLKAGLSSTGGILRSMSLTGSAPKFTARMTKRGVPFAGVALAARFTVVRVTALMCRENYAEPHRPCRDRACADRRLVCGAPAHAGDGP
jgi:L-asparagine permease